MQITYTDVVRMLGYEYEGAIDCMWQSHQFDDEVDLRTFLRAWTAYITETTEYAAKNSLI